LPACDRGWLALLPSRAYFNRADILAVFLPNARKVIAMFVDDDLDPKNGPRKLRDLSKHSLAELDDYVAALRAEIERAEAEKDRKVAHMNAAGALFKGK
jgi:uncharacterized small protein (DUF1192 family)